MSILGWIIAATFAMSLIAWVGVLMLFLSEKKLEKILLPLVAFSAGALIGGAFLHLLPEALSRSLDYSNIFLWLLAGFAIFFLLEQFIHWHHCHRVPSEHKKPVTYLILIADGVHNFIGGIAIAGSFLVSPSVGMVTWIAAAAHEIPQELGDFGILIYGGWREITALTFNFFSALTIVLGGIFAYFLANTVATNILLAFAAGNFIYIGAADLIPEIKPETNFKKSALHFASFLLGLGLIIIVRTIFHL